MNDKPKIQEPPETRDPPMQGEGNVTAARRYDQAATEFARSGRVGPAAREAAPADEKEAREMARAEEAGRQPARD